MLVLTYVALPVATIVFVLLAVVAPVGAARVAVAALAALHLLAAAWLFIASRDQMFAFPPALTGTILLFVFGFLQQSRGDDSHVAARVFGCVSVALAAATILLAALASIAVG